ncbi:hypothetical protein BC629DRAFT_1542851 [Irpex lacteus]|nr:hypothetical protein BC629DRAFT_1542851 [Irpex lacteus]
MFSLLAVLATLPSTLRLGPLVFTTRLSLPIALPLSPFSFVFRSPPLPVSPYPSLVDSEHPPSCRLRHCRSLCTITTL